VPVYLAYFTAWATPDDGVVHFRDDVYGHDATLRALGPAADRHAVDDPATPTTPTACPDLDALLDAVYAAAADRAPAPTEASAPLTGFENLR
jgi:hypothetical protein